jgi:hypothetical protein
MRVLDADNFDAEIERMQERIKRIGRIVREVFVKGIHYGSATGGSNDATKPSLLKPGAEDALSFLGLVANFQPQEVVGDGVSAPHLSITMRCEIHEGDVGEGAVVAVGYGGANTHEKKWRYRKGGAACPACSKPSVIKGKPEFGGGYLCAKFKEGCGKKWKDAEAIQLGLDKTGQVQNEDPFDLHNNLLKYAEKRALVDAVLRLGFSSYFGQDMEEAFRSTSPASLNNGGGEPSTDGGAPSGPVLDFLSAALSPKGQAN